MLTTWRSVRAAARARPGIVDAGLAAVMLAVSVIGLWAPPGEGLRSPDVVAYTLTLAGVAPYLLRSRFPLPVLVVASLPVVALVALGYSVGGLGVGLFLLLFTVAARYDRVAAGFGAAWGIAVLAAVAVAGPERVSATELVTNVLLLAAAFVLGRWARDRSRYVGWVEERAAILARDKELAERRAVAEERTRIAQELHDIVAHSLGVIAVQAGAARHVIDSEPAEAKASLEAIASTSRESLVEIRRILAALRSAPDDPGYAPLPGTDRLPALVDDVRSAGIPVTLHVTPKPSSVPVGVDLAAYRVVQESLTNVLTHAPGSVAEVTVMWGPDAVDVAVRDDGSGRSAPADGHQGLGLLGMRERVTAYGGSLHVGPRPGGGFEVRARIPFGEEDR